MEQKMTAKEFVEELEDIKLHLAKFEKMDMADVIKNIVKDIRKRVNILDQKAQELQTIKP